MDAYNYQNDLLSEETPLNYDDFVLMKRKGEDGEEEIVGGGYKVDSFFLKDGLPALTTLNSSGQQEGGKVSTPFENLAVPAGLFYINQRTPKVYNKEDYYYKTHETISDDMIDKLFGLIDADKKQKRKTRKHIKNDKIDKRKSRKQK